MLIACAAHWYESLLFVAPVGMLAVALKWSTWSANRREAAEAANRPAGPAMAPAVAVD